MFGRRKKSESSFDEDEQQVPEVDEAPAVRERPQGPWDHADAPDDEVNRVDLGGLRIPVPADTEVRVDVGPDGQVVAATLVQGENIMQVNVFAAPRSAGIWDEVRDEIVLAVREGGGVADEADGPWGVELHAKVPLEGAQGLAPARFLGVDGPRWFLRALLTGPAATDPALAAPLEAALRDVVVDRGTEAMAVRNPIPLRLPKEVTEQATDGLETDQDPSGLDEGEAPGMPSLPDRGPEITERR